MLEIYNNSEIKLCFFDNNIKNFLCLETYFKRRFILCYKTALIFSLCFSTEAEKSDQ